MYWYLYRTTVPCCNLLGDILVLAVFIYYKPINSGTEWNHSYLHPITLNTNHKHKAGFFIEKPSSSLGHTTLHSDKVMDLILKTNYSFQTFPSLLEFPFSFCNKTDTTDQTTNLFPSHISLAEGTRFSPWILSLYYCCCFVWLHALCFTVVSFLLQTTSLPRDKYELFLFPTVS